MTVVSFSQKVQLHDTKEFLGADQAVRNVAWTEEQGIANGGGKIGEWSRKTA